VIVRIRQRIEAATATISTGNAGYVVNAPVRRSMTVQRRPTSARAPLDAVNRLNTSSFI
jgi:hypothetical protein